MVNYACAFSQSESGKCFEWIIMRGFLWNTFCTSWGCYLLCFSSSSSSGSGSGSGGGGSSSSSSSTLLLLGHFSYRVAPIGTREKGQGNPSQSWILIPGTGFQSVEFWYLILLVSGIPDSLSCNPDSKVQDSRLHTSKSFPITESGFPRNHRFHGDHNAPCEKKEE